MKKSILIVMILTFSLLFNSCSLYEKIFDKTPEEVPEDVPAEGETHICAQSGMEIPEGEGMMCLMGEEEVWFSNEEQRDLYLEANNLMLEGEKLVPVESKPAEVIKNICAQSGVEIPEGEGMKMMKGDEVLWFASEEMLFTYLKDNKMTWMDDKIMLKEEGVNYCEVCSMQVFEDEGLKYMLEDKEIWFANEKMLKMYLDKMKMKVDGDKLVPAPAEPEMPKETDTAEPTK